MANPPPPRMPPKPKKPTAAWRLKLGRIAPWLFLAFIVGALVQVFLAGYGIENLGAQGMDEHVLFAHVVEMIPLLIIIFGFVGADWRAGVGGVVLLVQFQLQYMFLMGLYAPVLALHAFNGVLMIVVAGVFLMRRAPWAKMARPPAPQANVAKGPLRPGPPA